MSRRNLSDSVNKYSRSEQFQSIPHVSKQNTNCSERKLKLPVRVTETFPDTSDKYASDASEVIEQLGLPGYKDAVPERVSPLSLSAISSNATIKTPSVVAPNFVFNAVYNEGNSNLDCDRYFAQMDILYLNIATIT